MGEGVLGVTFGTTRRAALALDHARLRRLAPAEIIDRRRIFDSLLRYIQCTPLGNIDVSDLGRWWSRMGTAKMTSTLRGVVGGHPITSEQLAFVERQRVLLNLNEQVRCCRQRCEHRQQIAPEDFRVIAHCFGDALSPHLCCSARSDRHRESDDGDEHVRNQKRTT
jgi:hypothetical protein